MPRKPRRATVPAKKSAHEESLALLIRAECLPEPIRELRICKQATGRQWPWDFAWPEYRVAVEVQGGIWMGKGAHNTGTAITRDCEKGNEVQLIGWINLSVVPEQIYSGQAVEWITRALRLRGWTG